MDALCSNHFQLSQLQNASSHFHRPCLFPAYFLICNQQLSDACLQEAFRSLMFDELDFESQEWQALSPDAQDLLKKLLVKEPAQRITAQEALQHR